MNANLLLVDDNEVDRERIRRFLGNGYRVLEASTGQQALDLSESSAIDCVLLDYRLPDLDGMSVLERLVGQRLPVVMLTGFGDETLAVEAMKRGAQDYLGKGRLERDGLQRAVTNALEKARLQMELDRKQRELAVHVTELERQRQQLEASNRGLREREAKLRLVLDHLPALVWTADSRLRCTSMSGSRVGDVVAHVDSPVERSLDELFAVVDDADAVMTAHREALEGRGSHLDLWVADRVYQAHIESTDDGVIGMAMDVSEVRNLEVELRQAQKMDALGKLAGGVAHDFNNILTAILSFARFAAQGLRDDDAAKEDLDGIVEGGERGAELVRQLLAFSRRRVVAPTVVDVNETVGAILPMLERLVDEDVAIRFAPAERAWRTRIDRSGLEQVLVNLVVNARDAMERGGRVTLATRNATLDERAPTRGTLSPGDYVVLSVSDDGPGIPDELGDRIFDPFFTTKDVGQGTGLGLSTCYGIVTQAGGEISVYSEIGQGTTFNIYLPRSDDHVAGTDPAEVSVAAGGTETILVVEDDPQVRRLVVRTLKRRGYTVLEAPSGPRARALCAHHEGPLDLVVSDVVMPGESGPEFVKGLRRRRPDVAVLYMSGYAGAALRHRAQLDTDAPILDKPFVPETLARSVRRTLDEHADDDGQS